MLYSVLNKIFGPKRPPVYTITQGSDERWRWKIEKDAVVLCMSPVRGYETEQDARQAFRRVARLIRMGR